ncbi:MAG: T9SS type A sorting domain-containing protein [Prolixibacteraceae bacterium]|jgi:hypothetical protein|nr:T9SS type A sorting domain-containing protein [Prolixibacteraceae bacterium]
MKKIFLLFLFYMVILQLHAQQDTIRHLIFTEWRGDGMTNAYVELTNVGTAPVDLSRFTLAAISPHQNYPSADGRHQKRLSGTLAAGKSYVIMNVYEGTTLEGGPTYRTRMFPLSDLKVYMLEGGVENDSVSTYDRLLRLYDGISASVLWYHLENGDSVIVDAVNNDIDINTGKHVGVPSSVAGFESATVTNILVRKATIKRGNTSWDNARGVSLEDSEWLPIPNNGFDPNGYIFTTVGNHGDYNISIKSESIGISMQDTVLTVPWGILKGDSLLNEFQIDPNQAWLYQESPASMDSAYSIVRTGDKLTFYACGNTLQKMDFKILVSDPPANMARVFPLRNRNFDTGAYSLSTRYYVTHNVPVIDTIGNVPFATRADTLLNYLVKAPKATWDISWIDGIERVDLKKGDKLKVTAEDGTTIKEYFIDVQAFSPSSNANLSAITWPGIPSFIEGWKGDTIPLFVPDRYSYNIELPNGTTSVPALIALTQSLNASVQVKRAVSLKGSVEDRTTVFTVTAQDDTTSLSYSVLFSVAAPDEKQEFRAEPFFSQIIHAHRNQNSFLEIVNPGNVPISLDNYIVIRSLVPGSPATALQEYLENTETSWKQRYNKYVPGYRFQSLDDWIVKPGILTHDPSINPVLNPGEVFAIGRFHTNSARWPIEHEQVDIHFSNNLPNVWGESGFSHNALSWTRGFSIHYLFKIENDSILEGKKSVGDPKDYTLIDMFGSSTAEYWSVAGMTVQEDGWNFIRKPEIWHGNPESKGSFGTNPEDSEWIVVKWAGSGTPWEPISAGLGTHVMEVPTVYISTITSVNYIVSEGFSGLQSIQGDLSSLALQDFYKSIVKADQGQELTLYSGVDRSIKNPEDIVAGNDTLLVVSADKKNMTKYLLVNNPVDTDAVLQAKEGSGYSIEINNDTGTITGMGYGITLKEVLNNLIKPVNASLNVIDEDNQLVPLTVMQYDTTVVDTKLGRSFLIEVIAQDGVTVITYKIVPTTLPGDAFVISSVYDVSQTKLIISKIPIGTSVAAFFDRIEASANASVKILDKGGFERQEGTLSYDDRLVVTSGDMSKTVTYYLDFLNEKNPDRAGPPDNANVLGLSSSESLLVYPNPTNDRFYIKGLKGGEDIHLLDITGRLLQIKQANDVKNGISLSGQPSGMYFIISVDENKNLRRAKVIKK